MKTGLFRKISCAAFAALCMSLLYPLTPTMAAEDGTTVEVSGNVYKFSGKKGSYKFEDAEAVDEKANTAVTIEGNVKEDGEKNGVASYIVDAETPVSFHYNFEEGLVKAEDDEWHLVEDKSSKVAGITLDKDIQKGAVILQISNDGEKWVTVDETENAFADGTEEAFYETSELEVLNGCYYRVIVAYELSRQVESSKVLFVEKENFKYKKYAEVFECYLYDKENFTGDRLDNVEKIKLGERIKTEDKGYTGEKDIDRDDPHYGWDLGQFFVSGFTSKNTIDGTQYILKNVGDTVTLGFYLDQDIDQLNGEDTLSISRDKDGYDKAFEIDRTDFGRGTLIVQYTDPDGVTSDPQIYTNYLEANLSPKANTAIQLCEEGDYEVALDYEIKNDNKVVFGQSVLPEKTHYRIAFNFSVRNSNCMVYTFDNATGSELKNGNVTADGFYIDLANSQYLDVSVKKEVLEEGADGLTEDTRFNRKAKDKEVYDEEGIYTITVKNKAAELESEKKIYVGTNKVLKAYMVTGLPISEIQDKVAQGATIEDDGTIIELSGKTTQPMEETEDENLTAAVGTEEGTTESDTLDQAEEQSDSKTNITVDLGIVAVVIVIVAVLIIVLRKKKRNKSIPESNVEKEDENKEEENR